MRRAGFLMFCAAAVLMAQEGRLEFAEPVKLLSCDPASTVPCFRMKFNVMDAKGAPYGVQMPAADKLASSIKVKVGDQEITPFYAKRRRRNRGQGSWTSGAGDCRHFGQHESQAGQRRNALRGGQAGGEDVPAGI